MEHQLSPLVSKIIDVSVNILSMLIIILGVIIAYYLIWSFVLKYFLDPLRDKAISTTEKAVYNEKEDTTKGQTFTSSG